MSEVLQCLSLEGYKTTISPTNIYIYYPLKWASLVAQTVSHLLPASLGGFLMSASESELSSFQITVSVLGPGACEILCAP